MTPFMTGRILMEHLQDIFSRLDDLVWGPPMLVLILGTGLFLTALLRFMPARKLAMAFGLLWQGRSKNPGESGDISPFQALMTCLAATVGTGNIVGVATAIFMGGPGALFWMWCTALVGMATKYSEVLVAVHFRETDSHGQFIGGPMYAIKNGLGKRWFWLGTAFAIFGGCAGFGIGNMVQVNSMALALDQSFHIPVWLTAIVATLLIGMVILGGIQRIGKVAESLVPAMCVMYAGCALVVLVVHVHDIPHAFKLIVTGAFTPMAATGGFAGSVVLTAIRYGVARGIFCNEAGLGTAGIAQAAGTTSNAVRSGLIGMLGTFIDTFVVCTATGLAIVCSGVWTSGDSGVALSQRAFESAMPGFGGILLTISLVIFAFTTILGWSYYGEKCWIFLLGQKAVLPYRLLWVIMIPFGAMTQLELPWLLADVLNGLMAIPNIVSLIFLSPVIYRLTRDYFADEAATDSEQEVADSIK